MDPANPSGYYRLDLADPREAGIAARLFAARPAGVRLRQERLAGVRVSLADDAPLPPPAAGVLEVDAVLVTPPVTVRFAGAGGPRSKGPMR